MALANVYRYPITLSKKMLIDNLPKESLSEMPISFILDYLRKKQAKSIIKGNLHLSK